MLSVPRLFKTASRSSVALPTIPCEHYAASHPSAYAVCLCSNPKAYLRSLHLVLKALVPKIDKLVAQKLLDRVIDHERVCK